MTLPPSSPLCPSMCPGCAAPPNSVRPIKFLRASGMRAPGTCWGGGGGGQLCERMVRWGLNCGTCRLITAAEGDDGVGEIALVHNLRAV